MRRCEYCPSTHFTSSKDLVGNRPIATPDGTTVHLRCLREWLIDDALTRWLGHQTPNGRVALRRRLRLDPLTPDGFPTLKQVAAALGYSFPWVSQVQIEAMDHLKRQIASKVAAKDADESSRERTHDERAKTRELLETIVQAVESLAQHLDDGTGALSLPDLDLSPYRTNREPVG